MRHKLAGFYLPLKAIEFNVVDITCFQKYFVFFLYLFIIVDFLSHMVKKKKNPIAAKQLYAISILASTYCYCLQHFSRSNFFEFAILAI